MTPRKAKTFDREQLMKAALRALTGRGHSRGELREKLRRRGREEDVDAVLAALQEAGYLDDRRFAENYAAVRLEGNLGKMRVLRELRQRRIPGKLAAEVAEQTYKDRDEGALIDEFLKRKYRGKQLSAFFSDEKNLAGAYRRLRYAGFSAGASIRALKQYARAAETLDALESEESGPPDD